MTINIIFGIKQTSKKCESIVIQMVINNLSRIKCGKKLKKTLNIIEWRIIANKTRKCCKKNPRYYDNQYYFWNKATSKKWESIVAKMVENSFVSTIKMWWVSAFFSI